MYKKLISKEVPKQIPVEIVFQPDEMALKSIPKSMTEQELLNQEAIFFLKDVCRCLKLTPSDLKKRAMDDEKQGLDPWQTMGIRKTWTHWIVRMTVFKQFIEQQEPVRILRVNEAWDANTLLGQSGCFLLAEVCAKMPFTATQVRQEVRYAENSRMLYGVWKDPHHKGYLVDMPVFSRWIRRVWS